MAMSYEFDSLRFALEQLFSETYQFDDLRLNEQSASGMVFQKLLLVRE